MVELLAGERQKGESYRAVQACNDWLRMGPGRSIAGLHGQYQELPENTTPTRSRATLHKWSQKYGWPGRAEPYDTELERQKNELAREIMTSGLALAHERVLKLIQLAEFLEQELYWQDNEGKFPAVWLPDVKQIGSGDAAEKVDIVRFNASIIEEFRGVLDDLAKETGGRMLKADLTSQGHKITVTVGGIDLENDV
jgi:hypothetical protein